MELWGRKRRVHRRFWGWGSQVQQHVVVLDQRGATAVEGVQGEGRDVALLGREQVQHPHQACQGYQVLVVDLDWPGCVEGVQGEGGDVAVLEGQRMRRWQVNSTAHLQICTRR